MNLALLNFEVILNVLYVVVPFVGLYTWARIRIDNLIKNHEDWCKFAEIEKKELQKELHRYKFLNKLNEDACIELQKELMKYDRKRNKKGQFVKNNVNFA